MKAKGNPSNFSSLIIRILSVLPTTCYLPPFTHYLPPKNRESQPNLFPAGQNRFGQRHGCFGLGESGG